ncbi:MAG: glycoside hydrolase family 78 protein [Clostridia bacterium]|nr:glycoside hydrolase family 78 protein [Clostridia bacterium]
MKHEELFGRAVFVAPSEVCVSPLFRGLFTAGGNEKTEITVCGLGVFRLFINGKKVSGDVFAPVTSFYHGYDGCYNAENFGEKMNSRVYCMKYDITDFVVPGVNTVCAAVGPMWYKMYSDKCVFCYKISCGEKEIFSDTGIKWSDSPVTEYNFTCGEKQDYTKHCYDGSWLAVDFDDSEWKNTAVYHMPQTEFYIQDCPNDRVIRLAKCEKLFENREYTVYDAGENITGRVVFNCPVRGKKITVTVGEMLNGNDVDEKMSHYQSSEYICDGTDRDYKLLFTWQGFRYIKISAGAENVRCEVIHADIAVTSAFECENPVLNWIYNAYVRTQLCNIHMGIPSDCPHIERRGYTGDGQLVCESAMLTIDSKRLYLKWMEDIADSQDVNSGHIQYTAPYVRSGGGPGGWGCAIAEVPYVFYQMYGDEKPFAKYFDNMLHYFDYLEAHSENDLVVSDQPGEWCLGDWCAPHEVHGTRPEIPASFVNNYFYVRTIDRMLEMSEIIGRTDKNAFLSELRERKVNAINKNYFDSETGDYAENKNGANAFALDIGLGDEKTVASLVRSVREKGVDTGIFGTDLVPKMLMKYGYFDDAVTLLSGESYPSFGYMMKNGATTLWEEWKEPRSMSHPMFGSVVKVLFYDILGIKRTGAGFDSIVIAPKTNGVTGNVSGFITTDRGRISVSVDRKSDTLTVGIPQGVNAAVEFDGKVIYR